jgi:hypothetical protein
LQVDLVNISRDQQDRNVRSKLDETLAKLQAIHGGHSKIADDCVIGEGVLREDGQRFLGKGAAHHLVTHVLQ